MIRVFTGLVCACGALFAANPITVTQTNLDRPTLLSLGVQVQYSGDDNRNATATLQYRRAGDATYRDALPLFRVKPETVAGRTVPPQFAGSVFDLAPDTNYELLIRVQDPDGPVNQTIPLLARTRPVPAGPASPRAIPAASVAALQAAIANAQPGDVITLNPGLYRLPTVFMTRSGTALNPIVIRGADRNGVMLDGGGCTLCNILELYGDYVQVENLTLQNAEQAIRYQTAGSIGHVLRRVRIRNVNSGVNGRAGQRDFYFGDNSFEGRVRFPLTYLDDGGANGNYYGVALYGQGHVVANNEFTGFADSIRIAEPGSRSIDIYNNDVRYSYDDGVELDGGEGNVRAFRNRFTNSNSAASVQGLYGGPVYIFRNVGVNLNGTQVKFHAQGGTPRIDPTGVFVYHNTFVSPIRPLTVAGNAPSHDSTIGNNLYVGPDVPSGNTLEWFGTLDNMVIDNNGYYPDGTFFWTLPAGWTWYPGFAAMSAAGIFERNGKLMRSGLFRNAVAGPALFTQWHTPQQMVLAPTSSALDQAAPLANLNELFTGAGPDLGALEAGCRVPHYGPRPSGIHEANQLPTCGAGNAAPVAWRVSQANRTGPTRTFVLNGTDADGFADIDTMTLLLGGSPSLANGCAVVLDRTRNQVRLWNDAGTALSAPAAVGSPALLENAACSVQVRDVTLEQRADEQRVIWRVPVTPKQSTARYLYSQIADLAGVSSGWQFQGVLF